MKLSVSVEIDDILEVVWAELRKPIYGSSFQNRAFFLKCISRKFLNL